MRTLGVDVPAVCPYRLADKQEYVLQQARRYPYWEGDEEDDDGGEDWGDEDWKLSSGIEGHRHKVERAPGMCLLCGGAVEPDLSQRIEHWRQHHNGQDLTASQVAWLLLKSKAEVKSPNAAVQPDYRGPSPSPGGNGTRFWRLETLAAAVREGQQSASGN